MLLPVVGHSEAPEINLRPLRAQQQRPSCCGGMRQQRRLRALAHAHRMLLQKHIKISGLVALNQEYSFIAETSYAVLLASLQVNTSPMAAMTRAAVCEHIRPEKDDNDEFVMLPEAIQTALPI